MNAEIEEIFFRSPDDLLLHARLYRSEGKGRPAVCLPGLTRNGRDFHSLALALSSDPVTPRDVYTVDFRGRGLSAWDKDWHNYSPYTELLDVVAFLTAQGLEDAAVIGTSRGGIVAMLLSVLRPSAMGVAVLNDIGPVIETAGLARIMGYVGKIPVPRDWNEATRIARDMNKASFTAVDEKGWEQFARQIFNEDEGRPAAGYDPNLSVALSEVDISKPIPDMWAHFDAMASIPVMVLRGQNSDLLSAATVEEMQRRHPAMSTVVVLNEGHAPLLNDAYTQRQVADFFASTTTPGKAGLTRRSRCIRKCSRFDPSSDPKTDQFPSGASNKAVQYSPGLC